MTTMAETSVRSIATALLMLLGTASDAAAQGTPQYLIEYRAYDEAVAAGDSAAAIRHGRAAWQAAEQTLGDHRLTAILAYNYGKFVIFSDSRSADAALQRVTALLEAGIADLAADELGLYAGYARFVAGGANRRDGDRLRKRLTAVGPDGAGINPDLAPMWLRLAAHDATEKRYRKALDSATMAETAIRKTAPDANRALAEAIAIRGLALLVPFPRKVDDVLAAHKEFDRALGLFELQENIDNVDPLFAQLIAWNAAAGSALSTLDEKAYEDSPWPNPHIFRHQGDPSIECPSLEWERQAPAYPRDALREGYIGATLIGYRVGEDLRVHDARILAEVPQAAFGEVALESVRNWYLKERPPDLHPACLENMTTVIRFAIDD